MNHETKPDRSFGIPALLDNLRSPGADVNKLDAALAVELLYGVAVAAERLSLCYGINAAAYGEQTTEDVRPYVLGLRRALARVLPL